MIYECPYCGWSMSEPEIEMYEDSPLGRDNYKVDMMDFQQEQQHHDCPGEHPLE